MKLPKLKVNDRIEVLWHDAHDVGDSDRTWHDRDVQTPEEYYACLSLGYFLKQENGFLYLVADLVGPHVSRAIAIPLGCIKGVKKWK